MGERVVTATVDEAKRVVADDCPSEPDAARAENAALIIEHDARAEIDRFRFVYLGLDETAGRLAVVHRVFLQLAFARLVTDRAIERMIDEQRFEDRLTHLFRRG